MTEFVFGVDVGISIYSALILLFLFLAEYRQLMRLGRAARQQRAFLFFLACTFIVLAADFFSRLDGRPGWEAVARASNFVLFLLNPVLAVCWHVCIISQIDEKFVDMRAGLWVQTVLCAVNAAAVVLTPRFGLLYSFDEQGVYHRGPLFFLTSAVILAMVTLSELLLLCHRASFEPNHFTALLLFPVLPAAAALVQALSYGLALGLSSTVYAMLIVFYYVQDRNIGIDYLTGVYNRRRLDQVLRQKLASGSPEHPFAAILIDLDDFKSINDTQGHTVGDAALVDAARLLRRCLRTDTFIARYGGDEFCVVLDIGSMNDLQSVIRRINSSANEFNCTGGKTYRLSFSMGGAVYDGTEKLKTEEFERRIDMLMYENKRSRVLYNARGQAAEEETAGAAVRNDRRHD